MTRVLRFATFAFLILLVGCSSLAPLLSPPTPAPASTATSIPQATPTSTPSIPATDRHILRIWLPPQFDPNAESPAAELLNARLRAFESDHPGLQVEVRIKSDKDITTALVATSKAAPSALPDLIALSHSDMRTLASAGFLHPLEGLTDVLQDPDWYAFARDLGHYQNTEYGFPFASDALLLVYRPSVFEEPLSSWEAIFSSGNQIVFPVSDPQSSFLLSLYLSVANEQDLPALDEETLVQVLTLYKRGLETGAILPTIRDNQTDLQTLQLFRDGEADLAVVWASSDIATQSGSYLPLLGLDDVHYSLGDGWVWALAGPNAETQPVAVELAAYLVESDFMSQWTRASNYLPTRPQALEGWDEPELKVSIDEILQSVHPIPEEEIVLALRPLLQGALIRVFNGEQPDVVARSVIEGQK